MSALLVSLMYTLGFMAITAVIDFGFVYRVPGRWFILHAIGNFAAVIFCLEDLYLSFSDPLHALDGKASLFPVRIIAAIHIYHCVVFKDLRREDWVHHILMAGVICGVGMYFEPGPLMNVLSFFLSGLPGGIDYVLLTLVKNNKMDRLEEKKWNSAINAWLRAPGCAIAAFMIYMNRLYSHDDVSWLIVLVPMLLTFINGQYYGEQAIGNYHSRKAEERAEEKIKEIASKPRSPRGVIRKSGRDHTIC
eukprot:Colp12_sorted_trinity150504_noHs@12316